MRNKFLILFFFSVILCISCRKTRTCDCNLTTEKNTIVGTTTNTETTTTYTITTKNKQKKEEFKKAESCYNSSLTYTTEIIGGTTVTKETKKCTLK